MQIFVHKWGSNEFGEIEVRLNASLLEASQARSRNKLGYFRSSRSGSNFSSKEPFSNSLNTVMANGLTEMVSKLSMHFYHGADAAVVGPERELSDWKTVDSRAYPVLWYPIASYVLLVFFAVIGTLTRYELEAQPP